MEAHLELNYSIIYWSHKKVENVGVIMFISKLSVMLDALMIGSVLFAGQAMAKDIGSTEPKVSTSEEPVKTELLKTELPEKVMELVNALSGVERIETLENGSFAVYKQISVTGSRIRRTVKLEVTEDGEVLDWGQAPLHTRMYTRRELLNTSKIGDIAEALERLDPAIQGRGDSGR